MRDCFTPVESNEGKQGRAKLFLTLKKKKEITIDGRTLQCVITAI